LVGAGTKYFLNKNKNRKKIKERYKKPDLLEWEPKENLTTAPFEQERLVIFKCSIKY
jgi:hypothetical protein